MAKLHPAMPDRWSPWRSRAEGQPLHNPHRAPQARSKRVDAMRRLGLLWSNAWWKLVLLKILLYSSAASGQLTLASSVTAADANRLYGDPNPAFTGTITGIKNADNITATYASAATAASPVGTYAIVPT